MLKKKGFDRSSISQMNCVRKWNSASGRIAASNSIASVERDERFRQKGHRACHKNHAFRRKKKMLNPKWFPEATQKQLACLARLGIAVTRPISNHEANLLIRQNQEKWNQLPPTSAQRYCLTQAG